MTSIVGLQSMTSLVELYVGNNQISNIRDVFHLKVRYTLQIRVCGGLVIDGTSYQEFEPQWSKSVVSLRHIHFPQYWLILKKRRLCSDIIVKLLSQKLNHNANKQNTCT